LRRVVSAALCRFDYGLLSTGDDLLGQDSRYVINPLVVEY